VRGIRFVVYMNNLAIQFNYKLTHSLSRHAHTRTHTHTHTQNPIMLYPVLHDLVETLPAGPRRDCFVSVSDKYLNTPEDPV
jgi:hypothetical protein